MNIMNKLSSILRRDYGNVGCGKSVTIADLVAQSLHVSSGAWTCDCSLTRPGNVALGMFSVLLMNATVYAWNSGGHAI